MQWRKLDVPGMEYLNGAGVYYGAGPYEASSCEGEDVYIVGGANSAGQAAMNFASYARRVIMLIRGTSLGATMSQYLIDEISHTPNIEVQVADAGGRGPRREPPGVHLHRVRRRRGAEGARQRSVHLHRRRTEHGVAGRFRGARRARLPAYRDRSAAQRKAPAGWTLDRDPGLLETSVPGVFAVGDVRAGSVKRVASGVGEGSIAIQFVHQYLAKVAA